MPVSAAAEERRGAGEEPRRKAFEREMNEQACAGGEGAGGHGQGKGPQRRKGHRGTREGPGGQKLSEEKSQPSHRAVLGSDMEDGE